MKNTKTKLIGIIGGMGPEATALFFNKIIKNTPAKKDQDHFRILIYNNPKIPDRTKAILGKGESPLKELINSANLLKKSGVDFLTIPCISSHYYYEHLQKAIDIQILHIVEETLFSIKSKFNQAKRIGLLATSGTIHGRLFHKAFEKHGLSIIVPNKRNQEVLMDAIYGRNGIKAGVTVGEPKDKILRIADALIKDGAEIIIGGCTEIPLVIGNNDLTVPFIDTLEELAIATVKKAMSVS